MRYLHVCILALTILVFPIQKALALDEKEFVVAQLKKVNWGQYMNGKCTPVVVPNWKGFDTVQCTYVSPSGFGHLRVVMLNADAERLAPWLLTACADSGAKYPLHCAERLALRIKCQSNNQFPIRGFVDEGLIYTFWDGVTVQMKEFNTLTLHKKPTDAQQQLALGTGTVSSVLAYARVQGTTRAEFESFKNMKSKTLEGAIWQATIRETYQRAWNSPLNELMSAWAKANLSQIDHKNAPASFFDKECKQVAKTWKSWPISEE